MEVFLENQHLKASFSSKGAELQSLIKKSNGINYLWRGDAKFWGKHSPILFPIVGALKDNTYRYQGKAYHLPRHGFARDMDFDVQQTDDDTVVFTFSSCAATLAVYPFDFKLSVSYRLQGSVIFCTYRVENPAQTNLYFSIGGHPAFAVPLAQGLGYNQYELYFNADKTLNCCLLADGLISGEVKQIPLQNNVLPLQYRLFYNDALVFKDLKSSTITLRTNHGTHGLNFNFEGFSFFGIWAAKDADFVCLEPWCGIADAVMHNQELKDKEGIVCLPPAGDWQRTWHVDCF